MEKKNGEKTEAASLFLYVFLYVFVLLKCLFEYNGNLQQIS